MDQSAVVIRRATERDHQAIRALVRSERLNPTGINWPNFLVAIAEGRIIGAVQMRKHTDGSREVGSLVVAKEARGHGLASRLIDTLLADDRKPIWLITAAANAGAYSRWGFEQIEVRAAPAKIRRNHLMGSMARVISFFKRRPMRRLVVLERRPIDRRMTARKSAPSLQGESGQGERAPAWNRIRSFGGLFVLAIFEDRPENARRDHR
jgi:amino-acid N-acetyltransferase